MRQLIRGKSQSLCGAEAGTQWVWHTVGLGALAELAQTPPRNHWVGPDGSLGSVSELPCVQHSSLGMQLLRRSSENRTSDCRAAWPLHQDESRM